MVSVSYPGQMIERFIDEFNLLHVRQIPVFDDKSMQVAKPLFGLRPILFLDILKHVL